MRTIIFEKGDVIHCLEQWPLMLGAPAGPLKFKCIGTHVCGPIRARKELLLIPTLLLFRPVMRFKLLRPSLPKLRLSAALFGARGADASR